MYRKQFVEMLKRIYGVQPPADAVEALNLPSEIVQSELTYHVASYQRYMDSRNDEIQLARRTALFYSKFDTRGTGLLDADALVALLVHQQGLEDEEEDADEVDSDDDDKQKEQSLRKSKLLDGELEHYFSLFQLGKRELIEGIPLTQFEDLGRLAEIEAQMVKWRQKNDPAQMLTMMSGNSPKNARPERKGLFSCCCRRNRNGAPGAVSAAKYHSASDDEDD